MVKFFTNSLAEKILCYYLARKRRLVIGSITSRAAREKIPKNVAVRIKREEMKS